jgi:hypothetical protein
MSNVQPYEPLSDDKVDEIANRLMTDCKINTLRYYWHNELDKMKTSDFFKYTSDYKEIDRISQRIQWYNDKHQKQINDLLDRINKLKLAYAVSEDVSNYVNGGILRNQLTLGERQILYDLSLYPFDRIDRCDSRIARILKSPDVKALLGLYSI